MNGKDLVGALTILVDDSSSGQIAHTDDSVCVVHSLPLDRIDLRIDITTTAVEVGRMHVNHQWLSCHHLRMDPRWVGEPVVRVNDVARHCPRYDTRHDRVVVDLLQQVVRVSSAKLQTAQVIGAAIAKVIVDVFSRSLVVVHLRLIV